MAPDDEEEVRRRRREREDEIEAEELQKKKKAAQSEFDPNDTARLEEMIKEAEPLIEQLEQLYRLYVRGLEKRPPLERRSMLDRLMLTLSLMAKPSQAYRYKYSNLHSNYVSHREKWERMLRDFENGKIDKIKK